MARSDVTTSKQSSSKAAADGPSLSFYIPNLIVGGAEQVTLNIVNGLFQRGYDVELVLSHPHGKLRSEIDSGVPVVALGESRVPIAGIVAHIPRLVAYLDENQPDALISQVTHANVVCLMAGRLASAETRIVPTEHNAFDVEPPESIKSQILRRLAVRVLPTADELIAVSQGVADSLVTKTGLQTDDVHVLHNPIDIEGVRERATNPVDHRWIEDDELDVVLFVGRLHPQKDLETWLRAFARVHQSNPDTRAVIAGQGPLQEDLTDTATKLGIEDVVSIPGYVDNPYRFMHQASVFLLSSRFEGLPTVLIEAMACGCPIVSTDCPSGPAEILDNGEYGRLTPVGNVDAIATAVEQTLEDPVESSILSQQADDFAPGVVLDEYERFIDAYLD